MTLEPFLFTELNEEALTEGSAFDGVAFGTFRDMLGREITLDADDAADYVTNTASAIEATKTESGDLVGLPVDAQGHEKGDGAGWIVGVELVDGVIRLAPKWTRIGRELIGEGIRRFFSATIDVTNKVILGGTLTNWPATRDENNRLILRPIELQSGFFTVDKLDTEPVSTASSNISEEANMPDEIVEQTEEVTEVQAQPEPNPEIDLPPDVIAELMEQARKSGQAGPHQLAQIVQRVADQQAERRVTELLEANQRQWEITELAAKLTGNGERALPVKIETMADFLVSLNPNQFDAAKAIFETISKNGLIEFSEFGHSRQRRKKELPGDYQGALKDTVAAGNTVADFFAALPDLGNPDEYDLSAYIGGK